MISMWLISIKAKSTVGSSNSEMVTPPKQGSVSTSGFIVILALAFNCSRACVGMAAHDGRHLEQITHDCNDI